MGGIPERIFLDKKIQAEFLCEKCDDVLDDPIILEPCGHVFCQACIFKRTYRYTFYKVDEDYEESHTEPKKVKLCPVDNQPVTGHKNAPRVFMSLLNKLEVCCPFKMKAEIRCDWTGTLGELPDHQENTCPGLRACAKECGLKLIAGGDRHDCVRYLKNKLKRTEHELEKARRKIRELDPPTTTPAPAEQNAHASSCTGNGNNNLDLYRRLRWPNPTATRGYIRPGKRMRTRAPSPKSSSPSASPSPSSP